MKTVITFPVQNEHKIMGHIYIGIYTGYIIYIYVKKTKDKTTSRLGGSKFSAYAFLKGFILTGDSLINTSLYRSKIMPEMTQTHAGKTRLVGLQMSLTCANFLF